MGAQKLLRGNDASASLRHPQMAPDRMVFFAPAPFDCEGAHNTAYSGADLRLFCRHRYRIAWFACLLRAKVLYSVIGAL